MLRALRANTGAVAVAVIGSLLVGLSVLAFTVRATGTSDAEAVRSLGQDRVVSYYPEAASWRNMWLRFDEAAIDADLGRVAGLGFQTVRIFVPPAAFGFPEPDAAMTGRLARFVELADGHGLRVGLSIFDRFLDYGDVGASRRWMRTILEPYGHDERIAFVELRNEIDPRDAAAMDWARGLMNDTLDAVRAPVVLSVSGRAGIDGLRALAGELEATPPSAYGLHWYGEASYLAPALQRAVETVAPVPLFLGEVGYATNLDNAAARGTPQAAWAQEARQELVIRAAIEATRALGLPPPAIWMANDLDPAGVPGDIPAKQRAETFAYGLLRRGGGEKPAASAFRRYAAEGVLDSGLNLGFEQVGPYEGRLLPVYWRLFAEEGGDIAADAAVAHSGRVSVRLQQTGGEGTDRVPALWIDPPQIAVVPGQVYVASAWARLDDATGGNRIAISWYDERGAFLGQRESSWLPAGDLPWTPVQVEATAPPGAAALEVHLKSSDNTGTVWFDDVEID